MTFIKRLIPFIFIVVTLITLLLTLLPANQLGKNDLFEYDKLGHFGLFFIWTLFFGLTAFFKKWNRFTHLMVVLISALLFGLGIEVMQRIFPLGRSFDLYDWLADGLGSLFAIAMLYYLKQRQQSHKKLGINTEINHNS